jgi:site-specific recombinase XerD
LQDLNSFFSFYPKSLDLRSITQEHLLVYKNHLKNRQYATGTISRRISSLRSFFQWLLQLELIDKDPSRFVKPPMPDSDVGKTPELSDEHVRLLFTQPDRTTRKGARDYAIIIWLFHLGLRSSELANLQVKDIKYDSGWTLRVRGKRNKLRTLPLKDHLIDILEEYKRISGLSFKDPDGYLFRPFKNNRSKRFDQPLSNSYLRAMIQGYALKAGIKTHVVTHSARVTACGNVLEKQASVEAILNLFGWSSNSGYAMIRRYDRRRNATKINAGHLVSYDVK